MEPLAPSWREWKLEPQRAGAPTTARLVLVNDGSATWRSRGGDGLQLSYHWLDRRGNAIVWDGLRTSFPRPVAPGEAIELDARLVAPRPPGRYLLQFDLVEEHRFWLSEVGVGTLDVELEVEPLIAERRLAVVVHGGADARTEAALAAQDEPVVTERPAATRTPMGGLRSGAPSSRPAGGSNGAAQSVRSAPGPRAAATRDSMPRSSCRR